MTVKKIVYITPGDRHLGKLTNVASQQLDDISNLFLNIKNLPDINYFVIRMTEPETKAYSTIIRMSNLLFVGARDATQIESPDDNIITNPGSIQEIIASTKIADLIMLGVTQKELKSVLSGLSKYGFNGPAPESVNWQYDIYTLLLDLKTKESQFATSIWTTDRADDSLILQKFEPTI